MPRLGIGKVLALAICLGFGLAFVFSNVVSWNLEDMDAYWNAALRLRHGLPLYPAVADPAAADVYRYSPWFAWLWIPLTELPKTTVQVVWSAILLISIPVSVGPLIRHRSAAAICLGVLTAGLLFKTASTGNVHAVVVAVLVQGVARRSGPVWIAVAASLKFAPLVYGIVYAGRREWGRAALSLALTIALVAPAALYDLSNYPTDAGDSLSVLSIAGPGPYVALCAVAVAFVLRFAQTSAAWATASTAVVAVTPRLDLYGLTYLLVGVIAPRSQSEGASDSRRTR